MKRKVLWTIAIVFALLLIWFGATTSRAGYESPEYTVVQSFDGFEIREYAAMTTAATPMKVDTRGNRDSGFGRLFKYISGENEDEQKIAMTTPVFIEEEKGESPGAMMFVVPKAVAASGAPDPKSESVHVRKISAGRFAVLRFKGSRKAKKQDAAVEKLRRLMAENGLKAMGDPVFAFYDPPWTPEFLRRNEVLIRLAPAE